MKKSLFFLFVMLFAALGSWAQPIPGNPVTTITGATICQGTSTIDLPITADDIINVGDISLTLIYSSAEINTPSIIYVNPAIEAWGNLEANLALNDTIILGAYAPDDSYVLNLADGATLFTLRFNVGTLDDFTNITFYENTEGTSCEYGGLPSLGSPPFVDEPQNDYYIPAVIELVDFDPEQITVDQTICEGDDVAEFNANYASGEGTFTYQWQSSTTSATEGFSDIAGATAFYYDSGPVAVDTWFRRETTATLGGTECVAYSNVVKVTVINFDAGTISGGEILCEDADVAALSSVSEASGEGTIAYQWQLSTTGESTGFSNIDGATTAGYDPGTISVDTWYRRMATSTLNSTNCSEYSNVVAVTVVTISAGAIGTDQYIAEEVDAAALTSETSASGDGTVTYQWQMSTTSGTEGFSNIDGATTATFDPGTQTADSWYRRQATATFSGTSCSEFSNVIAVVVINFIPGAITDDQTSCEAEDAAAFASATDASGDGTITYQWQSSTTSSTEGFSDIDGATSSTYDPSAISVDTWFRRAAKASLGGTELTEYSNTVMVTIINLSAGAIDNAQTICAGDDAAALSSVTEASGEGTPAYQWQSGITSATEGFSDIPEAISSTYDPGAISVDTWFRRKVTTTVSGTECVKYTNAVKITANQRRTISGTIYYYHSSGNIPLTQEDCVVKLYKTSDAAHETLVGTTVADSTGHYELTDICPECEYDLVVTCTMPNTGAINTTDAAQTNYWSTHTSTIEKVKFYAGDIGTVGLSQDLTINSTDAGRIQYYFVYGTQMDRKWTFWKAGTTISSNTATESYPTVYLQVSGNLTQDVYGLVTGDFNRSFNPVMTKAASTTLQLVYSGTRQISVEQEFDLPIRMVNASTVGAVSLILNFPSELVEVKDVVMNGAGGQLDWAVQGNELRIGWNSSTPLYLSENTEFITLRLKTAAGFTSSNPVMFTLAGDPLNEIADESYEVIGNAVLGIEAINGNALGIDEKPVAENITMSNYPNPFGNAVTLSYNLPENGLVTLEIFDLLGNCSLSVVNEIQTAGFHEVRINTSQLSAGLFTAALKFKSANDYMVKTIKLLKN